MSDPTCTAILTVWGGTVTLQRTPSVTFRGAVRSPPLVETILDQSIPAHDFELLTRPSDIAALNIQPQEKIQIGGLTYTIVGPPNADDGDAVSIPLRLFAS